MEYQIFLSFFLTSFIYINTSSVNVCINEYPSGCKDDVFSLSSFY